MILYEIIYALLCIGFAWLNAKWIMDGKRIYHAWNGLFHLIICGISIWLYGWHGVVCLFIARVFFDWSLNLFRGLPLGYVSMNPASITDKIERRIFGLNGILPKIIYVVAIVILNII